MICVTLEKDFSIA